MKICVSICSYLQFSALSLGGGGREPLVDIWELTKVNGKLMMLPIL